MRLLGKSELAKPFLETQIRQSSTLRFENAVVMVSWSRLFKFILVHDLSLTLSCWIPTIIPLDSFLFFRLYLW